MVYPVAAARGKIFGNDAYKNNVLSLLPLAYWRMEETSGTTAADSSGHSYSATYSNVTLGSAGRYSLCGIFDGATSFLNTFSTAFRTALSKTEWSISIWIKVASSGVWTDGTARSLANFQADSSNKFQINRSTTNNLINFLYNAGGTSKSTLLNLNATTDWVHICFTCSVTNDRLSIYVNGVLVGSPISGLGTFSGTLLTTQMCIGATNTAASGPFSGTIDEVSIFSREITYAEAKILADIGGGAESVSQNIPGRPAIIIVFDDGWDSVYTEAFSYLSPLHICATAYIITGVIGGAGRMTSAQLRALHLAGWTIGNHSHNHDDFTTLTQEEIETELSTAKTALENDNITGNGPLHVAYPFGVYDADALAAMTAQGMLTGRCSTLDELTLPFAAAYEIPTGKSFNEDVTLAQGKTWIDALVSAGEIGVALFHKLGATADSTTWVTSDFQSLIDYARSVGIIFLTIDDAYRLQSGAIYVPKT